MVQFRRSAHVRKNGSIVSAHQVNRKGGGAEVAPPPAPPVDPRMLVEMNPELVKVLPKAILEKTGLNLFLVIRQHRNNRNTLGFLARQHYHLVLLRIGFLIGLMILILILSMLATKHFLCLVFVENGKPTHIIIRNIFGGFRSKSMMSK